MPDGIQHGDDTNSRTPLDPLATTLQPPLHPRGSTRVVRHQVRLGPVYHGRRGT